MAHQTEFLIDRMKEEKAKAKAATLVKVKQLHERAARNWEKLANRALAADKLRKAEEKRKAEVRAEADKKAELAEA